MPNLQDYIDKINTEREILTQLLLTDGGELVSEDELKQRLQSEYNVTFDTRNGQMYFNPPDSLPHTEIEPHEIPISQAHRMAMMGQHPDDLPPVEERAKKQMQFDEVVDEEVANQFAQSDNPFPIEMSFSERDEE